MRVLFRSITVVLTLLAVRHELAVRFSVACPARSAPGYRSWSPKDTSVQRVFIHTANLKRGKQMPTNVGTLVVFGAIEEKWLEFGGLGGSLGAPITNESMTFDGIGRAQGFSGGIISWHPDPSVGAHVVWGLIGARWVTIGREQFGYPVTDEADLPAGGKISTFRAMQLDGHPEASIVWKPRSPVAWEVYGAIREFWLSMGGSTSSLGYPVQEEQDTGDGQNGRFQLFEGGRVSWHPGAPARVSENRRWAIILCRFRGDPPNPAVEAPIEKFYSNAFTPGTSGIVEYWRDASLGAIDISGSKVFDWIDVDLTRTKGAAGRVALAKAGERAILRKFGSHALDGFYGHIAIYSQNWTNDDPARPAGSPTWTSSDPLAPWYKTWIDGGSPAHASGLKIVTLTPPHDGTIAAHEMGHIYGMDHDIGPDLSTDYGDPCCIMSENGNFAHPLFGVNFGPALCLPHLMQLGWMYPGRVYEDSGGWQSENGGITLPLAPLVRPGARANLGIKLKHSSSSGNWDYYVEYVIPTEWNRGVPGAPYIFVRRLAPKYGGPAYLGAMKAPTVIGGTAEFIETSGNVRFRAELTHLDDPVMKVNVTQL